MRSTIYPSDVTDEQWALIEPLLPVYPGGRPRTTDVRDVLDAIFYVMGLLLAVLVTAATWTTAGLQVNCSGACVVNR